MLRTFASPDNPSQNHIFGLRKLILKENLKADLLLCPGDISDRADPTSLIFGWNALHELASDLTARGPIATAGNHDMDSRHQHNNYDAKGALQSLNPRFPGLSEPLCDRYWSRNFAVLEEGFWRLVVLNSSAYHGGGKDQSKESQHGRVSNATIAAVKELLGTASPKPLNILLCHHHLYRDNTIADSDYSEMEGAGSLLELLDSSAVGPWIVIHGHKHHPKLLYASGSGSGAVIFSAGSLSAMLYQELIGRARNQFYLVTLPIDHVKGLGLDIGGRIRAWDWIPLAGWKKAGSESGIPHEAGFGARQPITALATRVSDIVGSHSTYITWPDLIASLPELPYILPGDLEKLRNQLKSAHGIDCIRGDDGRLHQIGRSPTP